MLLLKETEERTIITNLRSINNIANMFDKLYMPLEKMMETLKFDSKEEAIDHKQKIDEYLKNYAILTLKGATERIEKALNSANKI